MNLNNRPQAKTEHLLCCDAKCSSVSAVLSLLKTIIYYNGFLLFEEHFASHK